MRLTLGMPSYNNLEEVWSTVQALRMYHDLTDCEILVIDNFGDPELEKYIKSQGAGIVRYEKCVERSGPAYAKNKVFEMARGEMVLCIDSHVFLVPGALKIPVTDNLLYGPLLYNDNKNYVCEWKNVFRGHMWGIWGDCFPYERIPKEPFEIWGSGSGCFATRKDSWLGFCPKYKGFGGEEGVLPEKYRKAGRKVLCQPNMIWQHMFERRKVPYPLHLIDRVHNYLVGFSEINLDLKPIVDHFGENMVAEARAIIAKENILSESITTILRPTLLISTDGPLGYTFCANEKESYVLKSECDVAYGVENKFNFLYKQKGNIIFDNATFGDPVPNKIKYGFYKEVSKI
jgi:glycosyltransferase involved in cell wall biosynthesis